MPGARLPPVAVIADAHFHDIESNYEWDGITIERWQLTLRSWADTRSSSRVFNESKAALELALKDIRERGIKHVVLLGDYSDDGQIEATDRLVKILRHHRDQYGIRFFAITGNHDAFGPLGKHQSTRFVRSSRETVLVTSDPKVAATEPESAVLTPRMYCEGVPVAISTMSEFGLFRQSEYLHWESPFGLSDSIDTRQYDAHSADGRYVQKLMDASYLVEPAEGLWLLMIDANVFEPRKGQWKPTQKKAFLDSSDAGWNSVLKNRPYLIDWISDVSDRAEQADKTLIAFSHYPIIDAFADSENNFFKLFGNTDMLRRKPCKAVSTRLLESGIRLHFSGHLHVNALSERTSNTQRIEDCAVPSPVAFPAGYKVVHTDTANLDIDTVHLSSMPLNALFMKYYQEENANISCTESAALATSTYGEFLYERMHSRVIHHYLAKEWPKDIAESLLNTTVADLASLMLSRSKDAGLSRLTQLSIAERSELLTPLVSVMSEHGISPDDLATCAMTQLVSDWYCLRHAGHLATTFIATDNINIYNFLANTFGDLAEEDVATPRAFFAIFLGMLKSSIHRSDPSTTRERILFA